MSSPLQNGFASADDNLVLVYTMACPLRCDYCCHPVEDFGPVKLAVDESVDWIHQAAEIPGIARVVFTGGEPFLYPKDLLEILRRTDDTDLPARIVTAAHWAATPERARAALEPLVEHRLRELVISTDPSHQEFVPRAYAENAARAASALGLQVELAGVFWDEHTQVEDCVDVPAGALTIRHKVSPTGRARNAKLPGSFYGPVKERMGGCRPSGRYEYTVYPDGEVYPCCSGRHNIDAKLTFGNARETPLAEIVARVRRDTYTRTVFTTGFWDIYALAQHRFPEVYARLPALEPQASVCHVCALVHGDPDLLALLQPVLEYADKVAAATRMLASDAAAAPASAP